MENLLREFNYLIYQFYINTKLDILVINGFYLSYMLFRLHFISYLDLFPLPHKEMPPKPSYR